MNTIVINNKEVTIEELIKSADELDTCINTPDTNSLGFNKDQMITILIGLIKGLDISKYTNPKFSWIQMQIIKQELEKRKDVSYLTKDTLYDAESLQIKLGLDKGLDVSLYVGFELDQMREIRLGLEKNLDISLYAKPEFGWEQMEQIRKGLEKGLNASIYAKPEYNPDKMKEIRTGLEEGIDVAIYTNPKYTFNQMKQIRLELEKGLEKDSIIRG